MSLLWIITETLPTLLAPGYSLLQVVWMRYGTHILVLLLILAPRQGTSWLRARRPTLQVGRGLLMLLMPISFIVALGHVSVSNVMAVFWLAPLLLLVFAVWVERERPPWTFWVAAATGILGAELIVRPDAALVQAAPFGLGMAISFSLYVVLTRSLREERTTTNLLYSALAVFLPLTLAMPAVWKSPALRDGLLMAGVGVVGLGVLWCIDRATDLVPVSVLAPIFPVQLTLVVFMPMLLTGVRPAKLALAGTALIVGSALAGWLLPVRRAAPQVDIPGVPAQIES